jgi:hypothetical protein
VLAREDTSHSVALAQHLIKTARDLDPDALEVKWN